jgi:hypothetical protein
VTSIRRWVIATQVTVAVLLIGWAIVILATGDRARPPDAYFDADEQGAATVGRAFDLLFAVFAFVEAAVVLVALRGWLKSGRWTLPFLADLAIAIPAALIVSPAGPTIGDVATTYLLVLAVSAFVTAILVARRPSKRTMGGSPDRAI